MDPIPWQSVRLLHEVELIFSQNWKTCETIRTGSRISCSGREEKELAFINGIICIAVSPTIQFDRETLTYFDIAFPGVFFSIGIKINKLLTRDCDLGLFDDVPFFKI